MVSAALAVHRTSRRLSELSDADRAWLVAGLTLAGMTGVEIADRTGCSLRLVRSIRAEPITQMAYVAQDSTSRLDGELRRERVAHAVTRRDLAEKCAEVDRLRVREDQLLVSLDRCRRQGWAS